MLVFITPVTSKNYSCLPVKELRLLSLSSQLSLFFSPFIFYIIYLLYVMYREQIFYVEKLVWNISCKKMLQKLCIIFLEDVKQKRENCRLDIQSDSHLLADIHFGAFCQKRLCFDEIRPQDTMDRLQPVEEKEQR